MLPRIWSSTVLLAIVQLLGSVRGQGFDQDGEPDLVFRTLPVNEFTSSRRIRVFGQLKNFTQYNLTFSAFTGIPYALPPVKQLRFQRPTLHTLSSDFRALQQPPPCPQLDSASSTPTGSEDCLFLNLFLPHPPPPSPELLPILLLIPPSKGEDPSSSLFPFSAGRSAPYTPFSSKFILVVPQFRLGSLGFLTTVNEDMPGNMGLFDLLLALEWLQRYAPSFSGDKGRITLLGGAEAGLLSTSPLAKGLFQRLLLLGGSPLQPILSLDPSPKLTFSDLAGLHACPGFPSSAFVRCMGGKSIPSLVQRDGVLRSRGLVKGRPPLPLIQKEGDGRFLPPLLFQKPETGLKDSSSSSGDEQIPLMVGVDLHELRGLLPLVAGGRRREDVRVLDSQDYLLNFLRELVEKEGGVGKGSLVAEFLRFEYFSGLNLSHPVRREQAWDVMEELLSDYLVHVPAVMTSNLWSRKAPVYVFVVDEGQGATGVDYLFGRGGLEAEYGVGVIQELVTNFVHYGSPLNAGIEWPQWREEEGSFLYFSGEDVSVSQNLRNRQVSFWTQLLPLIRGQGKGCSGQLGRGRSAPLLFQDVGVAEISQKFFIS